MKYSIFPKRGFKQCICDMKEKLKGDRMNAQPVGNTQDQHKESLNSFNNRRPDGQPLPPTSKIN